MTVKWIHVVWVGAACAILGATGALLGGAADPTTTTRTVTVFQPAAIGRAATLAPPRGVTRPLGVTGQHGPKGEPCTRILVIPGANDHVLLTTTTVKKGIKYTTTTYGTWRYRPGTKVPPAYPPIRTERVCAYTPKP